MDEQLRELCRSVGIPELSGGRVAIEAACKRIAALEAALREIDRIEDQRTIRDGPEMIGSCNTTCLQECGALARKALRKE